MLSTFRVIKNNEEPAGLTKVTNPVLFAEVERILAKYPPSALVHSVVLATDVDEVIVKIDLDDEIKMVFIDLSHPRQHAVRCELLPAEAEAEAKARAAQRMSDEDLRREDDQLISGGLNDGP